MTTEELAILSAQKLWNTWGIWVLPLGVLIVAFLMRLNKEITPDIDTPFIRRYWKIILIGIVLFAFGIRVWNIDYTGLHIDESNHYLMARNIAENGEWSYRSGIRDLTGIDLTIQIAFLHLLLGNDNVELASRLPAAIYNSLAALPLALIVYTITKSRIAALIAALLWAIDPFAVFWGRYARFYSTYAFWSLLALASIPRLLQAKKSHWLWIFTISIIGTVFARGWPILVLIPPLFIHVLRTKTAIPWRHYVLALLLIIITVVGIPILTTSRDVSTSPADTINSSFTTRALGYFQHNFSTILSPDRIGVCLDRFIWNDIAVLPLFTLVGLLGFTVTLFFYRGSTQRTYLVILAVTLGIGIFLFAVKCQIRWQWGLHILWILFIAIFINFIFQSLYSLKRPLRNTVLLLTLLGVSIGLIINTKATLTTLSLKPGSPVPHYFYFTNSRHWVEDSRSSGNFVREHAESRDIITTSMWQHLSYFWDIKSQFSGVILLSSKPVDESAYVTGGIMYWSDEQIKTLVDQAKEEGRGIWFIYDQAKPLSEYIQSTIAHEENIRFIADDDHTTVYYYNPSLSK